MEYDADYKMKMKIINGDQFDYKGLMKIVIFDANNTN